MLDPMVCTISSSVFVTISSFSSCRSFNTRGRILHAVKRILPCAPGVVSKALYLEGDRCINLVEEHRCLFISISALFLSLSSSPQGIGSLITHCTRINLKVPGSIIR